MALLIQFVKVSDKVDVKYLMKTIYEKWDLKPKLVISVTGGAWNFPVNSHVREVFRKGIVEAAKSTGMWIYDK